ncbi:MAG: 50S ribosomal protein L28 [Micavibrio aeruginosavorus]|uniref:Large ribosomal subunit protein bL28 n=1 Tax=Micavibrio aeruginosavorus TaxID=349221 RepID=A0A2W5N723_9BACT|nr:MAG: 50S ribosomal protein L28 [Micavibrio aeruginosavorus]
MGVRPKRKKTMSRRCMITGKMRMVGNNRSHAENKTKRTFEVNVQDTTVHSETLNQKIALRVTAAGLRTLEKKGGIDAFIQGTAKTKLDPALRPYKALMEKKLAKKAA